MEETDAAQALAALGHATRLKVFRALVAAGGDGLPAGALAERLGLAPATLSFHLGHLERAGLVRAARHGRRVFYAVGTDTVRRLLAYLGEDCCDGRPDLCGIQVTPCRAEDDPVSERTYNTLFLCTHNAGRSIMAECILNRLGGDTFRAFSAGSHPGGAVNPVVLDILRAGGYDTAHLRPKSWDEFADGPALDFVFTLCDDAAGEACPVWPGQPMTAHWPFPDPSRAEGTDAEKHARVAEIFRQIQRRIEIFTALPIASLDRLTLQGELRQLGEGG